MLLLWAGAYTSPGPSLVFDYRQPAPRRWDEDEDILIILMAYGFPL